jgi:ABC-type transport system involved in multi-copper enzyme maturation permease subunit
MIRRLSKELRQLAPWPLLATLLLFAISPFLGTEGRWPVFQIYLLVAIFAPAARVFGAEFDQRTIEPLLSQPLPRLRLWREKFLALALLAALAFAALQLARHFFQARFSWRADLVECLVALGGGPLASLYFRQSLLGLCGSVSLPGIPIWSWLFLVYLVRGDFHVGAFWVHVPPLLLYVPIAYVAARRLFLNLELDRTESRSLGVPRWLAVSPRSSLGPTARLFLKEIQIQASILLLVPLVLFAWAVIWFLARTAPPAPSIIDEVLRGFPSFVLLFVFPLAVGSTAIAAERQMGLSEWHSSLPISRARQWWIKILVVMGLSAAGGLLGGLAGYLDTFFLALLGSGALAPRGVPTHVWIAILSAATGVYASSRAREPFRALMGGLTLIALTLVPATSPKALQLRGLGLGSVLFPDLAGAGMYLAVLAPTLALLSFAFVGFMPEPWLSERVPGRALRSLVVGGLLLTIGFW